MYLSTFTHVFYVLFTFLYLKNRLPLNLYIARTTTYVFTHSLSFFFSQPIPSLTPLPHYLFPSFFPFLHHHSLKNQYTSRYIHLFFLLTFFYISFSFILFFYSRQCSEWPPGVTVRVITWCQSVCINYAQICTTCQFCSFFYFLCSSNYAQKCATCHIFFFFIVI